MAQGASGRGGIGQGDAAELRGGKLPTSARLRNTVPHLEEIYEVSDRREEVAIR